MKTGNGDVEDTVDDGSCWEKVKETVRHIKQQNKVVFNKKHVALLDVVETVEKTNRNAKSAFGYPKNLKTEAMYAQHESCYKKPMKLQFVCTEEHGTISVIDSGTKTKVDRGKYKIDAKIDLHGYSTNEAYDLLVDFVTSSFEHAHKCVLVITGWGSKSSGENSLRSNLHHWLQSDKIVNLILYYKQATPIHGGKGAFYVLLRKNKQRQISPDCYKKDL